MDAVIVADLARLELEPSQQAVYDRPIGLRQLHRDARTGAEHYLVRYPAGLAAEQHTHSVAQTVVVLEGRLVANGEVLGPGSYVHFPAGSVMRHVPTADEGCLFVTIFDGPFDVQPLG
jgi:quercetin dioxygenase-like cupin family protein